MDKAHWDSIDVRDFTSVEVWTKSGLVTFYVLAVIYLKTRRVHIAGITPRPNAPSNGQNNTQRAGRKKTGR